MAQTDCPEEVDVFKIPHLRMKQIVCEATEKISTTNFQDNKSLYGLLSCFNNIFHELKNHEEVENTCIMGKLQLRLTNDQIAAIVKDIHKHSHVREILFLIKRGFKTAQRKKTLWNILKYENKLRNAVCEFEKDFFPHMKHEEEVFQPLLMEYFSYEELKTIKEKVVDLHVAFSENQSTSISRFCNSQDLSDTCSSDSDSGENHEHDKEETSAFIELKDNEIQPQLIQFPPEITLTIFSYLSPKDLLRTSQVCKRWSLLAKDGQLWTELFPSRWIFHNDWRFGEDEDCDCNCKGSFGDLEEDFQLVELRSCYADDDADVDESGISDDEYDDDENQNRQILKSHLKRMLGMAENLLPYIGKSVQLLSLACSPIISNGLVFKILSKCQNIETLVMSQTTVTDYGLKGLFHKGGGSKLKVLDLSGCKLITDKSLSRLSTALGQYTADGDIEEKKLTCGCMVEQCRASTTARCSLEYLSLSGCYQVTDEGLRSLASYGGLPSLHYLDLSGCLNVTAEGLMDLVSVCPCLDHAQFFYCDNIYGGPYPDTASGCQNLDCMYRVCCRLPEM